MSSTRVTTAAWTALLLLALATGPTYGMEPPPEEAARIAALVPRLGNDNVDDASAARKGLEEAGDWALSALFEAMENPEERVRGLALSVLMRTGWHAPETPGLVIAALEDPASGVRTAAARGIRDRASSARDVLAATPALARCASDPEPRVRRFALEALTRVGEHTPIGLDHTSAVITALEDEDEWVRRAACRALTVTQLPAERAATLLVSALTDEHTHVREAAAEGIAHYGTDAANAAGPILDAAIAASDPDDSYTFARALEAIGPTGISALEDRLLEAETADLPALLGVVSRFDEAAVALEPVLLEFTRHPDRRVRLQTLQALRRDAPPNPEVLAAFRRLLLEDPDPDIRSRAARALSAAGEPPTAHLLSLLEGSDLQLRVWAASVLWGDHRTRNEVELGLVVDALLDGLESDDPELWRTALSPILVPGLPGELAAVRLLAVAEHGAPEQQVIAYGQLAFVESLPRSAIPVLVKGTKHEMPRIRSSAARALAGRGVESREAIVALLDDPERRVRRTAREVLTRSDPVAYARSLRPPDERAAPEAKLEDPQAHSEGTVSDEETEESRRIAKALEQTSMLSFEIHGDLPPSPEIEDARHELAEILLPYLETQLASGDAPAIEVALRTAGTLGPEAAALEPFVIARITDDDNSVAGDALLALPRVAPHSVLASEQVAALLQYRKPRRRAQAATALARMAPSEEVDAELRAALSELSWTVRIRAAESLWKRTGDASRGTPVLAAAILEAPTDRDRWSATRVLVDIGDPAASAVPALIATMEEPGVAGLAVRALGHMTSETDTIVPALLTRTHEPDDALRGPAITSLGALGGAAATALPELQHIRDDAEDPHRDLAAFGCWQIGGESEADVAVTRLARHLRAKPGPSRPKGGTRWALESLSTMSSRASTAAPAIVAVAGSLEGEREKSLAALVAVGGERNDLAALVIESLAGVTFFEMNEAAEAIAPAFEQRPQLMVEVTKQLVDAPEETRIAITLVLAELGPKARSAVPWLRSVLDQPPEGLQTLAAYVLWATTDETEPALSTLIDRLESPELEVRRLAILLLANMAEAARPALPALRSLADDDWLGELATQVIDIIDVPSTKGSAPR